MKRLSGCWGIVAAVVLLPGVGLTGGIVLDRQVLAKYMLTDTAPPDAVSSFHLMAEAWNTIHQSYVGSPAIRAQALTCGAIGGMVDALGDERHSRFLSVQMVRE